MSRKALFANLGDSGNSNLPSAIEAQNAADVLSVAPEISRTNRLRMRPILGSPDLISDPATTPVGAISQSLGEFGEQIKRADEIERKLSSGQMIIELDPALIDPSFIADRMPISPETLSNLTDAIREQGQINPILVRPHPEVAGRFQVAFGHRRLRAVASLGRSIKAVVRDLSDEQLVIAQGQENHERKDLSYIEKARFAHRLEQRFTRSTILAAMSIYKSDLSNMLSVISSIPQDIVDAIGPAHSVGRRGWIELAGHLADGGSVSAVRKALQTPDILVLGSDERFKKILASQKPKSERSSTVTWPNLTGNDLAKLVLSNDRLSLIIDRQKSPKFAEFVLHRLRDLFLEFQASSSERS